MSLETLVESFNIECLADHASRPVALWKERLIPKISHLDARIELLAESDTLDFLLESEDWNWTKEQLIQQIRLSLLAVERILGTEFVAQYVMNDDSAPAFISAAVETLNACEPWLSEEEADPVAFLGELAVAFGFTRCAENCGEDVVFPAKEIEICMADFIEGMALTDEIIVQVLFLAMTTSAASEFTMLKHTLH